MIASLKIDFDEAVLDSYLTVLTLRPSSLFGFYSYYAQALLFKTLDCTYQHPSSHRTHTPASLFPQSSNDQLSSHQLGLPILRVLCYRCRGWVNKYISKTIRTACIDAELALEVPPLTFGTF